MLRVLRRMSCLLLSPYPVLLLLCLTKAVLCYTPVQTYKVSSWPCSYLACLKSTWLRINLDAVQSCVCFCEFEHTTKPSSRTFFPFYLLLAVLFFFFNSCCPESTHLVSIPPFFPFPESPLGKLPQSLFTVANPLVSCLHQYVGQKLVRFHCWLLLRCLASSQYFLHWLMDLGCL